MRAIITGGGTGGHIYPALAIADELRRRIADMDILYVGSRGMESRIVPEAGYDFITIDVSGIDRSSMLKAGQSLIKFPYSFFQAKDIIKNFNPDFIVGTGGYVSFPVVLAGTYFAPKTFIHEQNAYPGLANRHLAKRVDCTMLTFAEAEKYLEAKRIKITGLPIRQEFFHVSPRPLASPWGLRKPVYFDRLRGKSRSSYHKPCYAGCSRSVAGSTNTVDLDNWFRQLRRNKPPGTGACQKGTYSNDENLALYE